MVSCVALLLAYHFRAIVYVLQENVGQEIEKKYVKNRTKCVRESLATPHATQFSPVDSDASIH